MSFVYHGLAAAIVGRSPRRGQRVKLVEGRLPLTGGAVGFLFRQRHGLNSRTSLGSSVRLFVGYFTTEIVPPPVLPFYIPRDVRVSRSTLLRDEQNGDTMEILREGEYKERSFRTLRGRVDQ